MIDINRTMRQNRVELRIKKRQDFNFVEQETYRGPGGSSRELGLLSSWETKTNDAFRQPACAH